MNFLKPVYTILKQYFRDEDTSLKRILDYHLNRLKMDDSRQVTRTVYGVVRKQLLIEEVLKRHSKRKLKTLDDDLLIYLKIAVFLMLFSKSFPDYAIINEVVKKLKHSQKGYANGVLRHLGRKKSKEIERLGEVPSLETKFSVSPFFLKGVKKIIADPIEILTYIDTEPVFHLRFRPDCQSVNGVESLLEGLDVNFHYLPQMETFEIRQAARIPSILLNRGDIYFQNTSSQLISIIAAKYAKGNVLDVCAAPGTKSFTISHLKPDIEIISNDIHPGRAQLMMEMKRRAQETKIHICISDLLYPSFEKNRFDLILLDAPCTATGTARKNPDVKMKLNLKRVTQSAKQQVKLLQSAFTLIKKGGYILYSVCSFMVEEGDGVIEEVIKEGGGGEREAKILDLDPILDTYGFNHLKGKWGNTLTPTISLNNDLFYITLIQVL